MSAPVDVHQLKKNLESYLHRAAAGETLDVEENGQLVARIGPAPPAILQQLEGEGRLLPATNDLLALGPPTFTAPNFTSDTVLAKLRGES